MIEVIYQGEKEKMSEDEEIKLPKNVRQIGDCTKTNSYEDIKIYVEDFAMTYIKHFGSNLLRYGVLLGNIKKSSGNTYFFITGVVCAKPVLDNEIVYDEKVWTGIYEDIKMYFDDDEIVGWFASMPGMLENDMLNIQKLHLDNFAGNDKICFVSDRIECEDSFYYYSEGGMKKSSGHFIYYEKNEDMQSYMLMNEEVSEVPENYEQIAKRSINAKVHKLLYKNEESFNKKRSLPTFAYSASSFMIIAVLLVTIALMNTSGQMEELKAVVAAITKENNKETETSSEIKIEEASTSPELTTKENKDSGDEETKEVKTATEIESDTSINQETTPAIETTISQEVIKETETSLPNIVPVQATNSSYTVQAGDSLYSISIKIYGTPGNVEKIKEINNLTDENYIKEGDIILLP